MPICLLADQQPLLLLLPGLEKEEGSRPEEEMWGRGKWWTRMTESLLSSTLPFHSFFESRSGRQGGLEAVLLPTCYLRLLFQVPCLMDRPALQPGSVPFHMQGRDNHVGRSNVTSQEETTVSSSCPSAAYQTVPFSQSQYQFVGTFRPLLGAPFKIHMCASSFPSSCSEASQPLLLPLSHRHPAAYQ